MPMRIDAKSALSRSKNYQSDELKEYRYLADEVASLETEVLQLIMDTADTGKTSVIYNFGGSDKETYMKARLLSEALHRLGFNTNIFFGDYEADYPTGYRVVIMWG